MMVDSLKVFSLYTPPLKLTMVRHSTIIFLVIFEVPAPTQ